MFALEIVYYLKNHWAQIALFDKRACARATKMRDLLYGQAKADY